MIVPLLSAPPSPVPPIIATQSDNVNLRNYKANSNASYATPKVNNNLGPSDVHQAATTADGHQRKGAFRSITPLSSMKQNHHSDHFQLFFPNYHSIFIWRLFSRFHVHYSDILFQIFSKIPFHNHSVLPSWIYCPLFLSFIFSNLVFISFFLSILFISASIFQIFSNFFQFFWFFSV